MSTIRFETKLFTIGAWTILQLPLSASKQLPSRGIAMVKGTLNGAQFQTALEPDGRGSHWFKVEDSLLEAAGVTAGDSVMLAIEPTKDWSEPEVPTDIADALIAHPAANATWHDITPMARREWIRWIRATNQAETRTRRIQVACSKLENGKRRPCCFNTNVCTEPSVSKNWMLLDPAHATT